MASYNPLHESTYLHAFYAAVYDKFWCEATYVVHVKCCNHLLTVDMAGMACRGLWYVCGWKNVKRYRNRSL